QPARPGLGSAEPLAWPVADPAIVGGLAAALAAGETDRRCQVVRAVKLLLSGQGSGRRHTAEPAPVGVGIVAATLPRGIQVVRCGFPAGYCPDDDDRFRSGSGVWLAGAPEGKPEAL